ncbi:MAG TPA: hypothetical protein VGK00_16640 [Anaerolineales bacterium]
MLSKCARVEMQRFKFILRILAACSLLVLALVNIGSYARITRDNWEGFMQVNGGVDDVTRWENRFAELKLKIPADAGVIGYISEDPTDSEFILTQYAIIPFVLRRGTTQKWIIANIQGKPIHQVLENLGLKNYSVENYGFGLYLIHKK